MNREVKLNTIYKHFKGFKAYVIAIAKHSETGEDMVIYVCNSDEVEDDKSHQGGIYARPLDMFLSEVDHEKYPDVPQKYRFEEVKN